MTEKTELCGFQPKGDASQIPKPPKFNRDSLSEEGRVSMPMEEFDKLEKLALSVHTDKLSVEKLQERCDKYEKALINIKWRTERDELETYYVERNHDIHKDAIDALAAIGGDDEKV